MGDSEGEFVFPVRSVFNRTTSTLSLSSEPSASHADAEASSARGEQGWDLQLSNASDSNNMSKDFIQEESKNDCAPTQQPTSPTANHANFDRRKAETEKVSSSVSQSRSVPRGIDRNVHLSDPNQPLPEDEEMQAQLSSTSLSNGVDDSAGPTKEEEEMRERDHVATKMEDMGDSNSSGSRSDEDGTRVSYKYSSCLIFTYLSETTFYCSGSNGHTQR